MMDITILDIKKQTYPSNPDVISLADSDDATGRPCAVDIASQLR